MRTYIYIYALHVFSLHAMCTHVYIICVTGILCVRDRNRIVFLGCSGVPPIELRRPLAGTDVAGSIVESAI